MYRILLDFYYRIIDDNTPVDIVCQCAIPDIFFCSLGRCLFMSFIVFVSVFLDFSRVSKGVAFRKAAYKFFEGDRVEFVFKLPDKFFVAFVIQRMIEWVIREICAITSYISTPPIS